MRDPALIDRANVILGRLFALDEGVANARAFRAYLEELHKRDLSGVVEPHVSAVAMARAGILRSAITAVMACLDRGDQRRGNRASVGQILGLLDEADVSAVFAERSTAAASQADLLQEAKRDYEALLQSDTLERGRRLRDDAIAHLLIRDDATPEVTYETIYGLHDAAERLVTLLYKVCYRGDPPFLTHKAKSIACAKVFWETYFVGMRSAAPRG
jgi:hypothetical protein